MDSSSSTLSYADIRSASLPSQRVAEQLHKYHTKQTHMSSKQPYRPNSSSAAYNPHWSNSRVVPIANPSPVDPRLAQPLTKRELWQSSQQAAEQNKFRLRKMADRPSKAWGDGNGAASSALQQAALGDIKAADWSLTTSISSLNGDELSKSTDVSAEVRFWRGRETADELVDGALRKWKSQRKRGAEKMGWTVVLDGADGEGAVYDVAAEGEEEWEVLSP